MYLGVSKTVPRFSAKCACNVRANHLLIHIALLSTVHILFDSKPL